MHVKARKVVIKAEVRVMVFVCSSYSVSACYTPGPPPARAFSATVSSRTAPDILTFTLTCARTVSVEMDLEEGVDRRICTRNLTLPIPPRPLMSRWSLLWTLLLLMLSAALERPAALSEDGVVSFYSLLELEHDASAKDIKKAYRKKALEFHPDKFMDAAEKEEVQVIFVSIVDAYEVLSDPDRRRDYDLKLARGERYSYSNVDRSERFWQERGFRSEDFATEENSGRLLMLGSSIVLGLLSVPAGMVLLKRHQQEQERVKNQRKLKEKMKRRSRQARLEKQAIEADLEEEAEEEEEQQGQELTAQQLEEARRRRAEQRRQRAVAKATRRRLQALVEQFRTSCIVAHAALPSSTPFFTSTSPAAWFSADEACDWLATLDLLCTSDTRACMSQSPRSAAVDADASSLAVEGAAPSSVTDLRLVLTTLSEGILGGSITSVSDAVSRKTSAEGSEPVEKKPAAEQEQEDAVERAVQTWLGEDLSELQIRRACAALARLAEPLKLQARLQAEKESEKRKRQAAEKKQPQPGPALVWSREEESALAKACARYPGGTQDRWERIAAAVNAVGKRDRKAKDVALKAKQLEVLRARSSTDPSSSSSSSSSSSFITSTTNSLTTATTTTSSSSASTSSCLDLSSSSDHAQSSEEEDNWTASQQACLEAALRSTASQSPENRWAAIAAQVPGKSKEACVKRYKMIRDRIRAQKNKS
eukprot:g6516.t1